MVRRTYSIPQELDDDLTYIAGRVGVSRSALLTQLLTDACNDLAQLVAQVPENPSRDDAVRYRGKSRTLVEQRIGSLQRMADDLFSEGEA
jgi:hypothetical protein